MILLMPSRASTSLLLGRMSIYMENYLCVNALTGLYLIATVSWFSDGCHGKLWCQCPHGLVPHFYRDNNDEYDPAGPVSMPSRASTSLLLT